VYLPIKAPNKGIKGKVSTAITPDNGSRIKSVAITTKGVMDAKNNCGSSRTA
jgi:hypothetical protein